MKLAANRVKADNIYYKVKCKNHLNPEEVVNVPFTRPSSNGFSERRRQHEAKSPSRLPEEGTREQGWGDWARASPAAGSAGREGDWARARGLARPPVTRGARAIEGDVRA